MSDVAICCPSCRAMLRLSVERPGDVEGERWRSVKQVARATSQPPSRLRRWVREGLLEARSGPRGGYLVRSADVERLIGDLPTIEPSEAPESCDEFARLRASR